MIDKNLIKLAIRSTEKYSRSQYIIFDLLVDVSIDYEVNASTKFIVERTGFIRHTVATALKALQKDAILIKNFEFQNTYRLNEEKLKKIIELYHTKQTK